MFIAQMHITTLLLACVLSLAVGCTQTLAQEHKYVFENLGPPMQGKNLPVRFVSPGNDGGHIAWTTLVDGSGDRRALIGVHSPSGEVTEVDVTKYGNARPIALYREDLNRIYLYVGRPGRFLSYDVATGEIKDLGVPADDTGYRLDRAAAMDEQGRLYVGSYPGTHLVMCDPATDEVRDLGVIADNPRQQYILRVYPGPGQMLYCAVGLHHKQLFAYHIPTGKKQQILPESLAAGEGWPKIWPADDGEVYGEVDGVKFVCRPNGIEILDEVPDHAAPEQHMMGREQASYFSGRGELILANPDTGETRIVENDFTGASIRIYSVDAIRDGYIYGGGFSPAKTFRAHLATGKLEDLGRVSTGSVQIYDTLNHPRGLFLSSYSGANIDLFDPAKPVKEGVNPIHVTGLEDEYQQERITQLSIGPDGQIYGGSIPIKGHLGGALIRVDPRTLDVKVWRNVVPNQSVIATVAIPESGELLVGTSIEGGTSAEPTEPEAVLFVWDCENQRIVEQLSPISDSTRYPVLVRARNGTVIGTSSDTRFFAIDPVTREVLYRGELPHQPRRFAGGGLLSQPVGQRGLLYGIGVGGHLFTLDPETFDVTVVAQHESLTDINLGAAITPDGVLYYGSGANLMRCQLPQ